MVQGDAADHNLLESEGIATCDALVTLTGQDELNMIISLYGNSQKVPQVITKLGHSANRNIIDSLSLGSIVCPRDLICNNIVRYVRAMENQTGAALSVHTIADGQVEALEFLVDEELEALFPAQRLCRIEIQTKDGAVYRSQRYRPDGEAQDNVDMAWIEKKFRRITAPLMTEAQQTEILELLQGDLDRPVYDIVQRINRIMIPVRNRIL